MRERVILNGKLPSIRTVAAVAGVSTATVSNVLNARSSVAPDLAARVRAAVAEVGYIADLGAARLRSRRSRIAGLLVPDLANSFFGALAANLESLARRDGYDLLIVSSDDDLQQESARLRALLTWRPAGIIVVPCEGSLAARELAAATGVRIVAADRISADSPLDSVGVDNRAAAGEVMHHLIATGRRHILAVAANGLISNVNERIAAAETVAHAAGARLEVLYAGFTLAENRAAIAQRLAGGACPDALFTLNNVATLGALGAIGEIGLDVPEEIALVGFDDAEWMEVTAPPITAVQQPVDAIGQAAWAQLMARLAGDAGPPVETRLKCTLKIRASTAPRRALARSSASRERYRETIWPS